MDDNKIYYVYKWIRLDKNEVFYIGKGKNNRYKDLRMRNRYFLNIVHKIGLENIKIELIEENLDEQTAFEKEKYYIEYYKKLGAKLTNMTSGGEGSSDWWNYLTENEKENHREVSKSFLGRKHTEETKQKIRNSHLGKHFMSEDGKKRLSEYAKTRPVYFKGKHHTEETKRKLSEARKGKQLPTGKTVYVLNMEYKIIDILRSRTDAMNKYGQRIRKFIERNISISSIKNIYNNDNKIYIYKQDYDKLFSQSTIETILSNTVDKNNGVEYHENEIISVAT